MSDSKIRWNGIGEGPIKGKSAERADGWTLRERGGERFMAWSYSIIKGGRGNWTLNSRTVHGSFKETKAHAEQLEADNETTKS